MKGKATKPDNDTKPSENLNNSSIINDQNKGPQSSKPDKSVNKYSSQQTLSVAENLQLPEGPLRKEKRKKSNIKGKGGGGGVSFREVNDVISPDMDIPLDLLKKFKPKFNIFQSRKIELSSIQVMSFSQNNEKKTESPRHRPTKNANFDGDFKINIQNENMNQVFSSINTTHIRKRLQEDEIELIEALEKNSYINIYKAFYKDRFIILKIVEVNNKEENDVFDEDDVIEDFQNEHDIYEKLLSFSNYSINNIISIYAREREIVPSREKTINAVMACEFGRCSMEDILRTREKYTEGEIIGIFTKLVEALKVAHSARIAHRDLTPKNLTLGDDLIDYIICGFGTGIILENSSINTIMTNEIIQKKHFLPPELAENHLKFKDFTYDVFKADIYSLGICVLIMMGIKNEADLEKIRDEKAKVIIFKNLEKQYPNILTIIKKMVCNKPAERIELIEISKLLENHADKIVEIDEIEYLKEYENILNNKNDLEAIEFLEGISHGYNLLSSYKKSIPYLERALTIKEKVYGKSSLECSKSYEAMGNSYFGTKDFDKALKSYEKSLSIYRELYKEPGNILISNALFLLGLTHFEKNEYKLSIDSLEKSLEVLKKVKNLVDIKLETAKVQMAIGKVYSRAGDHKQAIERFNTSFTLRKEFFLRNHILVSECLIHLGNEHFDIGEYSKSLEYYQKGLRIKKNIMGEFHPEIAQCYHNIGTVNDRLGYQDLAKENYEQALTIYRKLDLESTIEIAATYTNLAETFNDLGEHKSAYDLNSKALKIYRQNFGDIDIQIIKCLLGIGNSFMHLNEFEKSKLYYEDSFNMAIHIYGSNSCALDISKSLAGLGSLYLCLGDFKKSLDFNQQSWKMLIELNEHSESKLYKTEIAMVLNNIGKVYEKFNDYHEAEKFHLESYSIRKEILGDKHPELINSLKNLACIYEKLGEKTKGFEKLQEALVIRRKFFGEDSALVASTLKKLADLNTCASPNEVENKKS